MRLRRIADPERLLRKTFDILTKQTTRGKAGWDPDSNQVYAEARISTDEHPICPVCQMDVDPATAPKSVYKGKSYYFCMQNHKNRFDAAPDKFVSVDKL